MKPTLDIRQWIMQEINQLTTEDFMNFIKLANDNTLSVDGKPVTSEELKAVVSFVRYLRKE